MYIYIIYILIHIKTYTYTSEYCYKHTHHRVGVVLLRISPQGETWHNTGDGTPDVISGFAQVRKSLYTNCLCVICINIYI